MFVLQPEDHYGSDVLKGLMLERVRRSLDSSLAALHIMTSVDMPKVGRAVIGECNNHLEDEVTLSVNDCLNFAWNNTVIDCVVLLKYACVTFYLPSTTLSFFGLKTIEVEWRRFC